MAGSRPLFFLDVDGVIGRWGIHAGRGGSYLEIDGYVPLDVDERIGEWLRGLDAAFEVVWASRGSMPTGFWPGSASSFAGRS